MRNTVKMHHQHTVLNSLESDSEHIEAIHQRDFCLKVTSGRCVMLCVDNDDTVMMIIRFKYHKL